MATVQMNTRIDEDLKRRGDEIFRRHGYTTSQVVRAVWEEAVRTGDVLDFMRERERAEREAERERRRQLARDGAGLAMRVAVEQCGYTGPTEGILQGKTFRELRDEMYDDMLTEMEEQCLPTRPYDCCSTQTSGSIISRASQGSSKILSAC